MKELIIKKDNNQITLMDKEEIQTTIDDAIIHNTPGDVNILVTYDDDTTETLHLKGHTTWSSGSSGGGSSSGSGSADSSSND